MDYRSFYKKTVEGSYYLDLLYCYPDSQIIVEPVEHTQGDRYRIRIKCISTGLSCVMQGYQLSLTTQLMRGMINAHKVSLLKSVGIRLPVFKKGFIAPTEETETDEPYEKR